MPLRGARAAARALTLRLWGCALADNGLGDEGAASLAGALHYVPQLTTLNLGCSSRCSGRALRLER